jgi:predicted naringenin-chalcone synthase
MYTVLEAIATANPPYKLTQAEAADFMLKTLVQDKKLQK